MIAILDMGSNSFIFLVVSKDGKGVYERVYEVGIAGDSTNFDRALATFEEIERLAKLYRIPLHIFGTAFFRKNPELFQKITKGRGRIISEEEEARYSYLSVVRDFCVREALVADLGGGSLELCWENGFVSLELGTHVLNKLFHINHPFKGSLEEIVTFIREKLPKVRKRHLFGIGGSFVTLCAYLLKEWNLDRIHGMKLSHDDVWSIVDEIRTMDYEALSSLSFLPKGREKTLLAGAIVALSLLEEYGGEMTVSTKGYRYGIAYELLSVKNASWRARGDSNPQPPDPQSGALSN